MSDRLLVLVRHGQSDWNLKNLFTGWKDPDLTEKGVAEAKEAGVKLKAQGLSFDVAFTSVLTRAQHTLDLMLAEIGQTGLPTTRDLALNERDYGDLSGLNKDDARKKWGEDQVLIWRRSYDVPPPGGESLKDTLARALPYYVKEILPRVLRGERTLVAAHGNSLRALIMVLEKLTPEQILKRELATGAPVIYRLNADSTVASKVDLAGNWMAIAAPDLSNEWDKEKLRNWMANAKRHNRDDIYQDAFRQLCRIEGRNIDDPLEAEFAVVMRALEEALSAESGTTKRLSRTRQKLNRVGVRQTLADLAMKPTPSTGFLKLVEFGMARELSAEALVLKYESEFEPATIDAAKKRLSDYDL